MKEVYSEFEDSDHLIKTRSNIVNYANDSSKPNSFIFILGEIGTGKTRNVTFLLNKNLLVDFCYFNFSDSATLEQVFRKIRSNSGSRTFFLKSCTSALLKEKGVGS